MESSAVEKKDISGRKVARPWISKTWVFQNVIKRYTMEIRR